jgi:hypothetical protein
LKVSLNQGDGTLGPPVTYQAGSNPETVSVGDLNGDGKPDVFFIDHYGNGVLKVSLNQGDGTLGPPVTYQAGSNPETVSVGDMDGDGKPDLVVADVEVNVLRNIGGGAFAPPVGYPVQPGGIGHPFDVTLGDLNGDGKLDVVATVYGAVMVMINQGKGVLGPGVQYFSNTPYSPTNVTLVDMNGDGQLDLVALEQLPGGQAFGVAVLLNHDGGTFGPPAYSPASTIAFAVADLNGDGKPDVIAGESTPGSSSMRVLLNQGDGTLSTPADYPLIGPLVGIATFSEATFAVADLDGDGKPDVAAFTDVGLTVFLNDGNGTFGAGAPYPPVGSLGAIGDMNGDGKPDLAVGATNGTLIVLLNKGGGTFAPPLSWYGWGGGYNGTLTLTDMNGDGRLDAVSGNNGSSLALSACLP